MNIKAVPTIIPATCAWRSEPLSSSGPSWFEEGLDGRVEDLEGRWVVPCLGLKVLAEGEGLPLV
jgi:hypothetical protein